MNIRDKFLELTMRTYPHGTENEVFPLLNSELVEDEFGNLFIKIGESDVMFTAHLDTATSALASIQHKQEGNIIKTDGTTILGADDKAGVTIMLYMIENKIPGLYYFFLGEEVGCVGSRKVASKYKSEKIEGIKKVISFDRRGNSSVITFQSGSRCCSDKFGQELAKQLNDADSTFSYKTDPTGLLTDSIQFTSLYPECTNISVGYQYEHTFNEQQDIEHLEKLAKACLLVDWNSLPVERDPSKTEYSWGSYYGGYGDYGYDYGSSYNYGNYDSNWMTQKSKSKPVEKTEKIWFMDNKFDYVSNIELDSQRRVKSVDLCQERVAYEKKLIEELLVQLDLRFENIKWNGFTLDVIYSEDHSSQCDRNDLIEYLPELDYSDIDELSEESVNEYLEKQSQKAIIPNQNFTVKLKEDSYSEWDFLDSDLYD